MYLDPVNAPPGSVLRVWSSKFNVFHFGILDWPDPLGRSRVTHSQKGSYVRTTLVAEFSEGNSIEVVWSPSTEVQQSVVLDRIHALYGKPYDLWKSNCEHVVNWAVVGKAVSPQLAGGVLLAGFGLFAAYAISQG